MRLPVFETSRRQHGRHDLRQLIAVFWVVLLSPTSVHAWSLEVEQGNIGLKLPDIRSNRWQVIGSTAQVQPAITASGESAVIEFSPTSTVTTERLAYTGAGRALQVQDLRADLSEVTVTLDYGAGSEWPEWVVVAGPVNIDAARIEYPPLEPQAWNFQGTVEGRLADLRLQGSLVAASGLEVNLDVNLDPDGTVRISVDSVIEGQEGVRALAESFSGWPELLTIDSGNARVSADVQLAPEAGLKLTGHAVLDKVSGVFNRTAFSGVTGDIIASLKNDRITARVEELRVEQVNPGIPFSGISVTADYTGPASEFLTGRLEVRQASARFLDGLLRVPAGEYNLEQGAGRVPVEMQDLSLARLMDVYPADGLAGSGLLSGRIPVRFSRDDIQVEQGRVSAEAPGGRIQLPAHRLEAMLGGNQAMDLVVQALQNFHYSVLFSTIDYDETGKLTLGLRLEGENPDIRGGQPVVLNVNLEDDIPALLTSLQLSGRVNEAVTERVRELLQQPGQEALP